jgi:hypothetical protein
MKVKIIREGVERVCVGVFFGEGDNGSVRVLLARLFNP